jgi:hypothetical protein
MYVHDAAVLHPGTAMGGEEWHARACRALYQSSLAQGQRGQILSRLTGRSRCLLRLADVEASLEVHDRCDAGVQTVSIARIRGSGDRAHDFDTCFHPLQSHTRARWHGIALARQQGVALPPVALIQIGDIYFVTDGHHRISVARAHGQTEIEARVTAWQVTGSLPWYPSAKASSHSPAGQSSGISCLVAAVRRTGAQISERIRVSLRELLNTVGMTFGARHTSDTKELLWT